MAWLRDFMDGQLRKPTGFVGRYMAARYMTRANVEINRCTLEALAVQPDDRVLEIGPGPGDLMELIAERATRGSVTGVDFSREMIETCERRFAAMVEAGRIELRCTNAEELPFAAGRFSKACTVNTIYFWPEPVAVLNEIRRVLRPGGTLAVSFIALATMQKYRMGTTFRVYGDDEVACLLGDAGFGDVRVIEGTDRRGQFRCAVGTRPDG